MTSWKPDLPSGDARPLFTLLAEALRKDVLCGTLRRGDRLPTHRDLARRLGIAIGTVTRAYAEARRSGLIVAGVGRGTFVRSTPDEDRPPPSTRPPAGDRAPEDEGPINLGARDVEPTAEDPVPSAVTRWLSEIAGAGRAGRLIRATPTEAGYLRHRQAAIGWVARQGLEVGTDRVLIANGPQHALSSWLQAFTRPGDTIMTSQLTCAGLKAIAQTSGLKLHPLAVDDGGILPDALEEACRQGHRRLYCVPTIHNPTTATMDAARRRAIADRLVEHDVLFFEDEAGGLLPDDPPVPLTALAPDHGFYAVTLLRTLAPGLRVSFLVAPSSRAAVLDAVIKSNTWMTSPIVLEIAARIITEGIADESLAIRRREASIRLAKAREILRGLNVHAAPSGTYLWLSLPEPWRSDDFAAFARLRGVVLAPASRFAVGRTAPAHGVRISFGHERRPERMAAGLATIRSCLGDPDGGTEKHRRKSRGVRGDRLDD